MNYPNLYQGESWLQEVELLRDRSALLVGPAADFATKMQHLRVALVIGGCTVYRFHRAADGSVEPGCLPLEVSADQPNVIRLQLSREQTRGLPPGQMEASILAQYGPDATYPEGRAVTCEVKMGYVYRSATSSL